MRSPHHPDDDLAGAPGAGAAVRPPLVSRPVMLGFLWSAVTVAIFSGWFVVTRFSVARDLGRELGIWDISVLRFGVGALILSPALFRRGAPLPLAAWREGFLFSLLWGAPFVLLLSLGLQLTSAAQAAAITPTMMPVFAGLLSWIFLRQAQGRLRWLGYAAIVAGIAGMTVAASLHHGAPDPVGIAVLASGSAAWATYTLLFRRSALTPIQSAALICAWSTLLILPPYLAFDLGRLARASTIEILLQAGYQGVLVSSVAIVAFNRSVTLLGPIAATAIIALIPGTTAVLAAIFLGESPSLAEGVATAAIALGVLLATRPAPTASAPRPVP